MLYLIDCFVSLVSALELARTVNPIGSLVPTRLPARIACSVVVKKRVSMNLNLRYVSKHDMQISKKKQYKDWTRCARYIRSKDLS